MSVTKVKPNHETQIPQTVKTTLVIDRELWMKIRKRALELGIHANDIAVIAIELVSTLIDAGYIPDDLGYFLERRNPDLLKRLSEIVMG